MVENITDNIRSFGFGPPNYPRQGGYEEDKRHIYWRTCPYGQPGDRLWVKETWHQHYIGGIHGGRPCYRTDNQCESLPWKTSLFMPHWASRITMEIVNVRMERVQKISDDDAESEGVDISGLCTSTGPQTYAQYQFQMLWDSINAKRGYGWDVNPWVWVIEFKKLEVVG
jgi:hypothetical protein